MWNTTPPNRFASGRASDDRPPVPSPDLVGSLPTFPARPGSELTTSQHVPNIRRKRLLFNRLATPGQVHVYSAECNAGQRLRVQMYVPVLPRGGAVAPAFAIVAQSLPYQTGQADHAVHADHDSAVDPAPPVDVPIGYSTIVALPPSELVAPVQDFLTRVRFYPGPTLDTRPLVGGRCYLVVWSPQHHSGQYVLQVGHRWSWPVGYWLQVPRFWWQIRGWFGLDRSGLIWATAAVAIAGLILMKLIWRKRD